jgi:hypothetical protein
MRYDDLSIRSDESQGLIETRSCMAMFGPQESRSFDIDLQDYESRRWRVTANQTPINAATGFWKLKPL